MLRDFATGWIACTEDGFTARRTSRRAAQRHRAAPRRGPASPPLPPPPVPPRPCAAPSARPGRSPVRLPQAHPAQDLSIFTHLESPIRHRQPPHASENARIAGGGRSETSAAQRPNVAITANTAWHHYGEHPLAPLRRPWLGAIMVNFDWLHRAGR